MSQRPPPICHSAVMAKKADLQDWVLEALEELGSRGGVVDVSKVVWRRHEADLRMSGDLFYTWQYDIRWAAQRLRDLGRLEQMRGRNRGPWVLREKTAEEQSEG